jgi:hypothetical protein
MNLNRISRQGQQKSYEYMRNGLIRKAEPAALAVSEKWHIYAWPILPSSKAPKRAE